MPATVTIAAADLARAAGRVPGVTILVVDAGGIRAVGSAGWADRGSGTPMSPSVGVPWFSMTKIATATLTLRLAADGVIDLEEPVAPTVDEVRRLRPATWAERITPRDLLQHTAGLANPLPVRWIHPATGARPDPDRLLASLLAKHARLRRPPGSEVHYSNLGALILAAALSRRGGAPFELLMRRYVLQPLAMTATDFARVRGIAPATGYHSRWDPLRLLLPRWVVGPATGRWLSLRPFAVDGAAYGGLVGSAADAARFVRMHLAGGELDGARVLPAEVVSAMQHIDRPGDRYDLGLGWFRPSKDRASQPPFVQHLGGGAGFFNVMRLYPSLGIGTVVMGNATGYDVAAVARLAEQHG